MTSRNVYGENSFEDFARNQRTLAEELTRNERTLAEELAGTYNAEQTNHEDTSTHHSSTQSSATNHDNMTLPTDQVPLMTSTAGPSAKMGQIQPTRYQGRPVHTSRQACTPRALIITRTQRGLLIKTFKFLQHTQRTPDREQSLERSDREVCFKVNERIKVTNAE